MIFKNQTSLKLIAKTNIDFNTYNVSSCKIKFIDPDGIEGDFDASVLTGSETEGKIYVDFSDLIKFTKTGTYILWSYVVFSDTTIAIGDTHEEYVYEEGLG